MPLKVAHVVQYDRVTTRYLLRDGCGNIWWGSSARTISSICAADPTCLPKLAPLDPEAFYPWAKPGTKEYKGALDDPNVFIKKQDFLMHRCFDQGKAPEYFKNLMVREVEVCELLAKNPHPNVCKYLGVVLDTADLITGIAYKRYDSDLFTAVEEKAFDYARIPHVVAAVDAGMKHLHSLALVHGDLRPENIFLRGEDEVVVGDFDACYCVGEPLEHKIGARDWWPAKYGRERYAEVEIDYLTVAKLPSWFKVWSVEHERRGKAAAANGRAY
ncbi:hypothetical protein BU26DRAFT_126681 [Trematosphaeria pertusa]|uniref:EKC/KEOPS complex subunit BUD32 n=1 Tax=Trematosphaeria pertusa TaxID=390896 RepID=A0A6A6HYL3_9PLEO|nr:uncharacterized protein BU26DRAFT_126681 [Trematosphaeria pertusa]KAF2243117.1 hypothetical protein BU26DRAFT_126681 [Trematosphaeria pertusa]